MKLVKSNLLVAGAMILAMSQPAQAIRIIELDAAGNELGVVSTTWTIYSGSPAGGTTVTDISGGAGTDWMVEVGKGEFGAPETGKQPSGIFGAGTTVSGGAGYRVLFDFDGYTWDSYNTTFPTNPGASDGYWDLFAMNINTTGSFYWDMVNGGLGALGDPLLSVDPAGTPVIDPDGVGPLAGATWGWGGLDYAAGYFEEEHGTFAIDLMATTVGQIFNISAVLDTSSDPQSDTNYPSWGTFNANGPVTPPDGGTSQDVPVPASVWLMLAGLCGLFLSRRRQGA